MEYLEKSDLYKMLCNQKNLGEKIICSLMRQIISAVAYLHSKKIIHGDIKLENILIQNTYYSDNGDKKDLIGVDIKLIDFGCSKFFNPNKYESDIIGTSYYVAPEVLNQTYNNKCDIWSLGIIMYILFTGSPPFTGSNQNEILNKILEGKINFNSKKLKKISLEAKDLLIQILRYNYRSRPSAYQILGHIWLNKEDNDKTNNNDTKFNIRNEIIMSINKMYSFNVTCKFKLSVFTMIVHNIMNENCKNLISIFNYMDIDHDGRISENDFNMCLKREKISILELDEKIRKDYDNEFQTNENAYLNTEFKSTEDSRIDVDDNEFNGNNEKKEKEHFIKKIFFNVDADRNGYIEIEEFIKANISEDILLHHDNLEYAFNAFFINDSFNLKTNNFFKCVITKDNIIKTLFGNKVNIKPKLIESLLNEIGLDSNAAITYEDFVKIIKSKNS